MAWDHPRGYEPLRATSKEFSRMHPEVGIEWDIRSLKEFGDMPIEDLIDSYDLITIDHPYMGQAYANQLLMPLDETISNSDLADLEKESVGPSFHSYRFQGHLFALPVDAAALVAVSRDDLIQKLGLVLPTERENLFNFYKKLPRDYSVAWALCPTDLWCTFLTLCAQDSGRDFIENYSIDVKMGSSVLDEIKRHLDHLHPESIDWNPIQILDKMGESDEIVYSPFLFGYTNYSRKGYKKNLLRFSNSPVNPKHDVSTILGGVGLAVSARCPNAEAAAAYVNYVASSKIQEGIYTKNGGQPGNQKAWESHNNNELCNDFFLNTIETMNRAYVRPQHKGWNQFQEMGADLLHHGIVKNLPSDQLVKDLNLLYKSNV